MKSALEINAEIKRIANDTRIQHNIKQDTIAYTLDINQSSINRKLHPDEALVFTIAEVILMAYDSYTRLIGLEIVRFIAKEMKMQLVPEIDRKQLNGNVEDEFLAIQNALSAAVTYFHEAPEQKRSTIRERILEVQEMAARALNELDTKQNTKRS